MKKLVIATVSGQLHALTMILSLIASNFVRRDAIFSLCAHSITDIGRAIKELNEARERDIAAMQEQVSEVMEQVSKVTSVLSDISTSQIPEEFRPQVQRAARGLNELRRTLPTRLTEEEGEELRSIYGFYDPLIVRYDELRKQFENQR